MSKSIDPLRTTTLELHPIVDHLITTGCSFTAGTSNRSQAVNEPEVWPHFVLRELQCMRFANLAIPGGGNLAAGLNLIYYLETHFCDPQTTLILLNITEFDRIDIPTRHHPDSNPHFSWSEDMGIEWITEGSFLTDKKPFHGTLQKNIGYETTVVFNVLQAISVQEYLCSRGYKYKWMYMSDRCIEQIPNHLRSSMSRFEEHRISFGDYHSMREWVLSMDMTIGQKNDHPNTQGHKKIADRILEVLKEENHA